MQRMIGTLLAILLAAGPALAMKPCRCASRWVADASSRSVADASVQQGQSAGQCPADEGSCPLCKAARETANRADVVSEAVSGPTSCCGGAGSPTEPCCCSEQTPPETAVNDPAPNVDVPAVAIILEPFTSFPVQRRTFAAPSLHVLPPGPALCILYCSWLK